MKKETVIFWVIIVVLVGLVGFGVDRHNRLQEANVRLMTLEEKLTKEKDLNDEYKKTITENKKELDEVSKVLESLEQEHQSAVGELGMVDKRLKGDGDIISKLDDLIQENRRLEEEVASLTLKIKAIEKEKAKEDEKNSQSDDEKKVMMVSQEDSASVMTDMKLKEILTELNNVSNSVKVRMDILTEVVSSLGPLSLERIMVQQEIEFLDETRLEIDGIKEKIDKK